MKLCMGCMNQMEDNLSTCPHCGFNEAALQQESYYLTPGTVVGGKYIVGRVLSYGGHTVSYLGMDAEAERKVVVKEYLPSDFSTRSEGENEVTIYSGDAQVQFERGLTNFLNEANKIQSLGSPEGIAEVYDCIAENDTGYVVSEYVQGQTLKDILASGKKYSPEEATAFISKILAGLSKVHPMNIVHCDIAPETIMVTDSGEIKLLDFGATRYVTTANSKSLAIILKQGYAPEEMYRSSGKRGPWTDVYALGAVMYRMITGRVPQEAVERTLVDELKEPSKLGVSIPDNIENALMNALNVYSEERTPSADVFLKELNSKSVKRLKVAKRKNDTGKFPVWAKGLVAALLCLVIAGGAYVAINGRQGNEKNLEADGYIMPSLVGLDEEAAKKKLKENKFNIEFNILHTYSSEKEELGKIADQSIPAGSFNPADYKDMTVKQDKNDSEVSGTMNILINTDEYITFKDIEGWGMSAYRLQQNLKLDSGKMGPQEEEDGTYWGITSISTTDGKEYTADDIQKDDSDENEEILIAIEDIKSINYSAKNFFYWEKLPDFKRKNIGECEESVYKLDMNNERTPNGNALLEQAKGLIREDCITCDGSYAEGDIVEQAVVDEEFDESKDMGKLVEGYLFRTIGHVFKYTDNSKECLEMLDAGYKDEDGKTFHFKNVSYASGNGENELVDYLQVKKGTEKVDYFTKEEMPDIEVVIYTKAATTQARPVAPTNPSPRPAPSNDPEF